jgi:threonine dehydrogenase-like Zn-dependent dehydrogenase
LTIFLFQKWEIMILIKIDAYGLCGSDFIDAYAWAREWKRFGHEIIAHVVNVGAGGDKTRRSVAVALSVPCGECSAGTSGNLMRCTDAASCIKGCRISERAG